MALKLNGPKTTDLPISEWERTDAALRAANKLFDLLHDEKHPKGSHAEAALELERVEVRRWAESIGERRHQVNIRIHNAYITNRKPGEQWHLIA
jgi:hypothetical protein